MVQHDAAWSIAKPGATRRAAPLGALPELVAATYEAAVGARDWREITEGLRDALRAEAASLLLLTPQGRILRGIASLPGAPDAMATYLARWQDHDPWRQAVAARLAVTAPPGTVLAGEEALDPGTLRGSEFYAAFGRRHGLFHGLFALAVGEDAPAASLGLFRREDAPPFDRAARRLLTGWLPHLRRAVAVQHQLEAATPAGSWQAAGAAAFEAMTRPLLLLDAEMTVVTANAAARDLARPGGPLRLMQVGGARHLRLSAPSREAELAAAVRRVLGGEPPGGALRLEAEEGPPVAAFVGRLPEALARRFGRPLALLLLRRIEAGDPAPNPAVLVELFGLTRAEAEVAGLLAAGLTAEAVAAARGTAQATVRAQASAILAKCGAANLRELALLLGRVSRDPWRS